MNTMELDVMGLTCCRLIFLSSRFSPAPAIHPGTPPCHPGQRSRSQIDQIFFGPQTNRLHPGRYLLAHARRGWETVALFQPVGAAPGKVGSEEIGNHPAHLAREQFPAPVSAV